MSRGTETADAALAALIAPEGLPRDSPLPLARQLYVALYDAITRGALTDGARLPAGRTLARELGVARNVVLDAYARLAADALVDADGRRGTRVTHRASARARAGDAPPAPDWPISRRAVAVGLTPARPLPLSPGEPDAALFPAAAWQLAMARAARLPGAELGYRSDIAARLQIAIARHLARYRSLSVTPDRIVVTSGTRQSLTLAAALYTDHGRRAWVESPGYPGAREAFAALGLECLAMPVDEHGAVPLDMCGSRSNSERIDAPALVYLTPCVQYPSGATLSAARRDAFIELSARHGAVLFEDDYDSEFTDDRTPSPALAAQVGAGQARVLHAGTFSKLLFPAARVAWLVVPDGHGPRARQVLRALGGGHGTIAQAAVADVLERGVVDAHLDRARGVYARRRRVWRESVATETDLHDRGGGGLCAVLSLDRAVARAPLEEALDEAGIGAVPLERFELTTPVRTNDARDANDRREACRALVIGLGNTASLDLPAHVATLARMVRAGR